MSQIQREIEGGRRPFVSSSFISRFLLSLFDAAELDCSPSSLASLGFSSQRVSNTVMLLPWASDPAATLALLGCLHPVHRDWRSSLVLLLGRGMDWALHQNEGSVPACQTSESRVMPTKVSCNATQLGTPTKQRRLNLDIECEPNMELVPSLPDCRDQTTKLK